MEGVFPAGEDEACVSTWGPDVLKQMYWWIFADVDIFPVYTWY